MVGVDFRTPEMKKRCVNCLHYLEANCNGRISGVCERYEEVENPLWFATKRWAEYHA